MKTNESIKNSQIRLETLNHAQLLILMVKNGESHIGVDIQNIHEILVVCHEAHGLGMDELIVTRESIKDWSIQLQTEGYRIA
ncbi:MAG: hypothetical protein CM15mV70_090 [Caudoviricetes sp.]|nr:MAG: hypothetical protein CM15mV70_090 [Caudoviricetes sp.]